MNNKHEFAELMQRPDIAWPTVWLFIVSWAIYLAMVVGYVEGWASAAWVIPINAIATYWLFTVFHDATHNAVSARKNLNEWLGRISILTFSPLPVFRAFRFIHMQHHRFANEDKSVDPDAWCGGGRWWTLPFRWATLDINYYLFYLPKMMDRPVAERRETFLSIAFGCGWVALALAMGFAEEILICWFIPSRIAIVFLAFAFDFLPHWPHAVPERENKYQATSNRVGLEWLLTPVLLYQNYHLVHHLYPRVPFYRYLKVWKGNEAEHLSNNPYLLDLFGRPLVHSSRQQSQQPLQEPSQP